MHTLKFIRENVDLVKNDLKKREKDASIIDKLLHLDKKYRDLKLEIENLQHKRKEISKQIGLKKKNREITIDLEKEVKGISIDIKQLNEKLNPLKEEINEILYSIPNIASKDVPLGKDEKDNVVVREWGNIRQFSFKPKAHWEIGEKLDIMDFKTAAKISGSRFVVMKGLGALLERALINFMLDIHIKRGYKEILPPYLVNAESLFSTGQLPRFEEDLFKTTTHNFYLIPTAEVPVTNIHRDEILKEEDLPIYYVAYSTCFRSEAGAAGKDTRGLKRLHQFNKVELVKFVKPENSYEELEDMVKEAELVLQELNIPYRVVNICIGDLGFTAAKKYDIEFYSPGQNTYIEVSSVSNCTDFQAHRGKIRFKRKNANKIEYVHTLNGSGLAVGRTIIAILENYQQEDGSVVIPKKLRPYMGGLEVIKRI